MKKYIINVTCYSPKNRVIKQLQDFARQYNKVVVDEHKLAEFAAELNQETRNVNERNPRCMDVEFRFAEFETGAKSIYITSEIDIKVTEIKDFILSEPILLK